MFHPDKLLLPERVWQCGVQLDHIAKLGICDYPYFISKLKNFSLVRNYFFLQTISLSCKFFCSLQKALTSQKIISKCLKRGSVKFKVKQRSQCPCSASVFKCRAITRLRCVMESGVGGDWAVDGGGHRSTEEAKKRKKKTLVKHVERVSQTELTRHCLLAC